VLLVTIFALKLMEGDGWFISHCCGRSLKARLIAKVQEVRAAIAVYAKSTFIWNYSLGVVHLLMFVWLVLNTSLHVCLFFLKRRFISTNITATTL
jgi:hypothetical protein